MQHVLVGGVLFLRKGPLCRLIRATSASVITFTWLRGQVLALLFNLYIG